jgi:uncharacterized protein YdeI (YjbR/CyaY-like superfamily)
MKTPPTTIPRYFAAALKKHPKAHAAFTQFPPSHKREYVRWITEVKTDAARDRRVAQAIAMIANGKSRDGRSED